MGNNLRPFFTYYGGKYRAAPKYPAPRYSTIVEPFAGSAGYALHYPDHDVVLIERNPAIAGIWRYLISVSPDDVMALPLWGDGWQSTAELVDMHPGARALIGMWLNSGTSDPRRTPSQNMRSGRRPNGYWSAPVRERIASQVEATRHWQVVEGNYTSAADVEATWFVDPPYQAAGHHYRYGSKEISYADVAVWARNLRGQVMVCEAAGAAWLPFQRFATVMTGNTRGGPRRSDEVLWTNGADGNDQVA